MSAYFQQLTYEQPPYVGQPAPWFTAPAPANPRFVFSSLGGRFILLSFIGDGSTDLAQSFMRAIAGADLPRNVDQFIHFGVTTKQRDYKDPLLSQAFPASRVFYDGKCDVAKQFGISKGVQPDGSFSLRQCWFLIDPHLRIYDAGRLHETERLIKRVRELPPAAEHSTVEGNDFAPVLIIPRVLRKDICEQLIELYKNGQPEVSGFMRQVDGETVRQFDNKFKRRRDVSFEGHPLAKALEHAVFRSIVPEILKVHQSNITWIERFIVACYDAGEGGFFRPHRDNTTAGTAHRKFAVTINLNAEEYEGGTLRFPEYGMREYKAPTGGAVVFSCSLLHEACPVTQGTRYATLPFLYDDEGAALRKKNKHLLRATDPIPESLAGE